MNVVTIDVNKLMNLCYESGYSGSSLEGNLRQCEVKTMTISIAEHLIEMGRQLDDYDVPDDNRQVTITQAQYDSLKEEVGSMTLLGGIGSPLKEYPNIKPMFNRFTINIEG